MGKGIAEWMDNNRRPVETVPARVVAKRSETSGNVTGNTGGMVSTWYYATFELDDAEIEALSAKVVAEVTKRTGGVLRV